MNHIKNAIDTALSDMKMPDDTISNVLSSADSRTAKKNRTGKNMIVFFICGFLLVGMTVMGNTVHYYWHDIINKAEMQEVNFNRIVDISPSYVSRNVRDERCASINDLESELGITFLHSEYENHTDTARVFYSCTDSGYHEIYVSAYIAGDASNILYENHEKWYSWVPGEQYDKPVDLYISFISDIKQQDVGREYMGDYMFVESFLSDRGENVDILKLEYNASNTAAEGWKDNAYKAIFVSEGIRYELDGRVSQDTLKDIVNSFKKVEAE